MKNRQGFTLVELIVAMAVSTIVLGILVLIFSTTMKTYSSERDKVLLNDSYRIISISIEKDIRQSSQSIKVTTNNNCTSIIDEDNVTETIYCLIDKRVYRNGTYMTDLDGTLEITLNDRELQVRVQGKSTKEDRIYEKLIYLR